MRRHMVSPVAIIVCSALVYALVLWVLAWQTNHFLANFQPAEAKAIWTASAFRAARTFALAALGAMIALAASKRLRARMLTGELLWSRVVLAGALGATLDGAIWKLLVKQLILLRRNAPIVATGMTVVGTVVFSAMIVALLVVRGTRRAQ